jgi:hypothetical protein
MTREMMLEFSYFVLLYWFCIIGFGVFFASIFYDDSNFKNIGQTVLTLFTYSLANFDLNSFDTSNRQVNDIGKIFTVIFLILTAIVLFNLLIAHMTSAYERVKAAATAEWSFFMATTVEQFILVKEPHALSTLPAPLNLITIAAYPFQWIGEQRGFLLDSTGTKKLTIVGTISTIILAMTAGGFFRLFAYYKRAYSCDYWYIRALRIMLLPFISIFLFLIYPLVKLKTQIQWINTDDTMLYLNEVLINHHKMNIHKMNDTEKRARRGIFSESDIARITEPLIDVINVQSLMADMENRLEKRFKELQDHLENKISIMLGYKLEAYGQSAPANQKGTEYINLNDLRLQIQKDMELIILSQQSILDELRS